MSAFSILTPAGYRRMPWKNGGGETIEIAVEPPGAGLDDFAFRVSMARVERDGPFSMFAGVERTLCVLEGAGIELGVAGREPTALTPGSAPYAFAGDAPARATLIDGPILDLNVMTRRGLAEARVVRLAAAATEAVDAAGGALFVLCRRGGARLEGPAGAARLAAGETLRAAGGRWRVALPPDGEVYAVTIRAPALSSLEAARRAAVSPDRSPPSLTVS